MRGATFEANLDPLYNLRPHTLSKICGFMKRVQFKCSNFQGVAKVSLDLTAYFSEIHFCQHLVATFPNENQVYEIVFRKK